MHPVAETLFNYLRDVIYNPTQAALDVEDLPEEFHNLAQGLKYIAECIQEAKSLAHALSKGDLDSPAPSRGNEIAAPLKSLQASLKHLTWQSQQVAAGDYKQRVEFMGSFSAAFNAMIQQLDMRDQINIDARVKLQRHINLLLKNCPDIILLFDIDERVVFTSESYLQAAGIPDAEAIQGKSFKELFAPVVSEDFLRQAADAADITMTGKSPVAMEQQIDFARAGHLRHYAVQITPMLDEEKTAVGVLFFFHDMTENIHAKQEAEHARDLAEQSNRAKSDFLARMSHEMRTPMNAIMGMTTIAQNSDEQERKAYCLNKINEASQHLLGVINDILDMSKIEADKLELSVEEFSFGDMIRRITGIFHFRLEERGQNFTVRIDENVPARLIADEQRLAQVVANLLGNAVKFTPEQGAVSLHVEKTAEEADGVCTFRFTVKDTGIGISEEQQKRLFVSFEQADGGISRKFGGTGLGLAISKRIVELMGGRIWVESALGEGAAFIFEIRARRGAEQPVSAPAQAAQAVAEQPDAALSGPDHLVGRRLLVAEDVDINREIIAALLEETGVEITFAVDGADAVAKFSADSSAHELILMDIHMPEVDGYEATRRIRASGLPGASDVPIIAMTANVFTEDIERCLAAGMNSHLGKPVVFELLVAELKKHLPKTSL